MCGASANQVLFVQAVLLLVHQVQLLRWLCLPLGCIREHRCALSTIHVLPCHGRGALQPLLPLLGASPLSAIADKGLNLVDTPDRDRRHCNLHLPLLLPIALPECTDLVLESRLPLGQPSDHVSLACTNHALALGHEYSGSRTGGIIRAEAVENYDGY